MISMVMKRCLFWSYIILSFIRISRKIPQNDFCNWVSNSYVKSHIGAVSGGFYKQLANQANLDTCYKNCVQDSGGFAAYFSYRDSGWCNCYTDETGGKIDAQFTVWTTYKILTRKMSLIFSLWLCKYMQCFASSMSHIFSLHNEMWCASWGWYNSGCYQNFYALDLII